MRKWLCRLFGHKGSFTMTHPMEEDGNIVFQRWLFYCNRCGHTKDSECTGGVN